MDGKKSTPYVTGIEPHPKNSWGGVFRWVLVALVVLGVGVLITTFALDNPIQQYVGKNNVDLVSRVNILGINKNIINIGLRTDNETPQYKVDGTAPLIFMLKELSGER